MLDQTNKQTKVGSLCMYAGFTQDASERGENENLFFFLILQNAFFFKNLLITSVNQVSAYSPWLLELTQT